MARMMVQAYPYATQTGTIEVPDNCSDVNAYVNEHFSEISFDSVELDYCGIDYEVYEMEKDEEC